jgi:dolichyl-phosphate-mannose--protein O-mannosyl transferase
MASTGMPVGMRMCALYRACTRKWQLAYKAERQHIANTVFVHYSCWILLPVGVFLGTYSLKTYFPRVSVSKSHFSSQRYGPSPAPSSISVLT